MPCRARTALVLLATLLLPACQNKDGDTSPSSPTAPTSPSTPSAPASGSALPNLAGTWRGRYAVYGEISGNDGVMTWTVQQNGSRINGTFVIQGDTLLGTVSGTISGSSTAGSASTVNHYDLTLFSSSISYYPGCTFTLQAREYMLATAPRQLVGTYRQSLCGYSSNLENGGYVMNKQ